MGVNLVTMRRMVRDRLGVPIGDSFFSDSVLDTNINLAIASFDSEMRWPWNEALATVTIAGGSNTGALPDDWAALRSVTYKDEVLESLPIYEVAKYQDGTGTWVQGYAVLDKTLHVAPTMANDVALTIIYYRQPKLVEDDLEETRCPAEHIDAVIAKACQFCAIREGERTEASDHRVEYIEALGRAKKELHRGMTRGVGRRIRPGAWL